MQNRVWNSISARRFQSSDFICISWEYKANRGGKWIMFHNLCKDNIKTPVEGRKKGRKESAPRRLASVLAGEAPTSFFYITIRIRLFFLFLDGIEGIASFNIHNEQEGKERERERERRVRTEKGFSGKRNVLFMKNCPPPHSIAAGDTPDSQL